jgi:hypothetical protein
VVQVQGGGCSCGWELSALPVPVGGAGGVTVAVRGRRRTATDCK